MDAWGEALALHPGIFVLGGDGSRDLWCVDLRDPDSGVLLTDIASSGWDDAEPLGLSVEQFVDGHRRRHLRRGHAHSVI